MQERVSVDASADRNATDSENDDGDTLVDVKPVKRPQGVRPKPKPVKPRCGISIANELGKPVLEMETVDEDPNMTVTDLHDVLTSEADDGVGPVGYAAKPKRRPKVAKPVMTLRDKTGMARVEVDSGDDDEEEMEAAMGGEMQARRLAEANGQPVKPSWLRQQRRHSGFKLRDELGKPRLEAATETTRLDRTARDLADEVAGR